jgi:molecular chaperone GrpE (heat shock protein)
MKKFFDRRRTDPRKDQTTSPVPDQAQSAGSVEPPREHNGTLSEQSQAQSLRMELDLREARILQLEQEVERLRERQEALVAETIQGRLEALFRDLAAPASQAVTQADLLENQGKPVQARDILAVTRRMLRALERHGLLFEGRVGETQPFDPTLHTPLGQDTPPQPGQPVTVRFVGVRHGGRILYKTIVE